MKEKLVSKKLVIKIGDSMEADEARIFNDPEFARKPTNTLYLDNIEQLHQLFSPKKFELLQILIAHADNPKSISQIAKKTRRKQEAISRDIHQLKNAGLLEIQKKQQTVHARPRYQVIEIKL